MNVLEMVRKALEEIENELAIQRAFAKKRNEGKGD